MRPWHFYLLLLGGWSVDYAVYQLTMLIHRIFTQLLSCPIHALHHPRYAFHAGLSLFQKRVALANVHHDATVPFSTAAMEPDCPYHDLACEPISDR